MPAHDWGRIQIPRRRTADKKFTCYEDDGTAGELSVGDVVRLKFKDKETQRLLLDLDTVAATANGSSVTINNYGDAAAEDPAVVTVRFAQDDIVMPEGVYAGEIGYVDDSETVPVDPFRRIAHGEIEVVPSTGGDVAKT